MLSPTEKKDKVIRSTDLEALSCRLSCNERGYLQPADANIYKLVSSYQKYLQYCEGYTNLSAGRTFRQAFNDRKFPLINRGTYLRTALISQLLTKFAETYGTCQIISMGGGSDTRCFEYLQKYPSLKYVELDFPETAKLKKLTILQDPVLQKIVKYKPENKSISVESKEEFKQFESDLSTENYQLVGCDLRTLTKESSFLANIDPSVPVLILSECVLCYLSPQENENVINFWSSIFQSSLMSIIIYEPISLNDAFGVQMSDNLASRGINLLTFNEFPTLESKKKFLQKLSLTNIHVTDISEIGGYSNPSDCWFSESESLRINKLELIDEVEEIQLLLLHYCLVYAERLGSSSFTAVDDWPWKIK